MKSDTAICAGLIGISLLLASLGKGISPPRNSAGNVARRVLAVIAMLIGAATLLQYLLGSDLGIDRLFLRAVESAGPVLQRRMAPNTALVFSLLAAALTIAPGRGKARGLVEGLELASLGLTILSSLALIYALQPASGFGSGARTVPKTAGMLFLLSLGAISLDPDRGLVALLRSRSLGGSVCRRLLPAAIGVPVVVGALQVEGVRLGLYEPSYGLLFAVLFDIVLLCSLVVWSARSIGRIDGDRRLAESREAAARKTIEDKYLALNERFSLAARAAKFGIWDWDPAEDRLVWDERMFELYGLSQGDFGGIVQAWRERLHPDDLGRADEELRRALSGDKVFDTKFRVVLGDGGIRHLRAYAQVTRDATGSAVRMTGINYDITEAERAAQEIARQNELLRQTGEMAKVGAWEFDAITGAGRWSEEVARIHDLDPSAGTSVQYGLGFYSDESRPRIEAAVKSAVDSARSFDLILDLYSAKGARKWVRTIGRPVLEGDKVVRVQGIFQDVTDLKNAESFALASERTLRLFVENSPAAIAMFDRDMRYVLASRRWLESYNLESQDLTGKSHYDIFPEISEDWKAVHRRCLAGAVERREEDPFRRADGSLDWVRWEVRPWYAADGSVGGIIIFSEVITERKNAELAVRTSEERFKNLFDNMVEGFAYCSMDFDGDGPVDWTYLAVNAAFERLTGLAGVVGKKVTEAIPGIRETDPELFAIYGRVAAGGSPERFEMDVRSLDLWFSVSVYSPERGFFVAVFDVITERKRAEEELEERVRKRTEELEAANAELESFSYSVSHDLRSPLRGIDGYVNVLLEEEAPRLSGTGRDILDKVRSGARQMGRLIDDLLEFARVGRIELRREEIDMDALVRSVLDELMSPGRERRIGLVLRPLLPASGDSTLIRQVWMNLIGNAIKFSSRNEKAEIEVACETTASGIRYYVRDNGAGFDMRYRAKLFGVFQRLHGSREFEGTGVGLAIVQRVVERHGGSVDAVGDVGRGATISFTLPSPRD
jgi:PAS domain S-box-containing protein